MSAPTDSSSSNSRQKPVTAATSPGRTFKTWLNYSEGMATKQEVAGKYGVDMREPDPSTSNQRALKLLRAAYEIIPDTVNANGAQFDYMDNSPEDDNRSAAQTGTTNYEHTGGSSTQQQQQNQQQRNAPRREVKKEDSQSVTGSHSSPSSSGRNKQTQSTSAQHATSDYRTNAWVTPKPEPDEDVEMQYLHGDHNRYQNQIPQGTQAFSHTTPHSQFHSRSPVERSPPMREYENRGAWSPHHSPGWSQHSSSCSQPRGFRTRGSIDFGVPSNTPTPELLSPGPTYSSGGSSYLPSASSDTSSTMNTPDRKPLNTSLGRSGERRDWGVPSKPFDRGYGTVEAKLMEFGNEERRGRSVWRNIGSSNRFGDWISQEGLPSNQRADVFDAGPSNMPRVQEAAKRRSAPAASNSAVVGDVHVQHKYTFSLPYGASLPSRTDRSGHGGGIVESPEDGVMTQEYYQQWIKDEQFDA